MSPRAVSSLTPASRNCSSSSMSFRLSAAASRPLPMPSDSIITSVPASYTFTATLSRDTGAPRFFIILT